VRAARDERTPASKAITLLFCVAAAAALAAAFASNPVLHAQAPPIARVDGGELQGVLEDGVMSFKGIRFAAPPQPDQGDDEGRLVRPVRQVERAGQGRVRPGRLGGAQYTRGAPMTTSARPSPRGSRPAYSRPTRVMA
jgi:hypothetical protein